MHRLKLGRETEERKKLKVGRVAGITVSKKVNKEGNLFFRKEQATSLAKHFYCGSSLQSQGRASEGVFISSNHWGRDKRACSVPPIMGKGQGDCGYFLQSCVSPTLIHLTAINHRNTDLLNYFSFNND